MDYIIISKQKKKRQKSELKKNGLYNSVDYSKQGTVRKRTEKGLLINQSAVKKVRLVVGKTEKEWTN